MFTEVEDTSLKRALRYDADDLIANRAGTLSGNQARRLRRERNRSLFVAVLAPLLLVLLAATVLPLFNPASTEPIDQNMFFSGRGLSRGAPIVGLGVAVFGLLYLLRSNITRCISCTRDLHTGRVVSLEGQVMRKLIYQGRSQTWAVFLDRHTIPWQLEFSDAFRDDEYYRIYFAPKSYTLLSADHLSPPPKTQ